MKKNQSKLIPVTKPAQPDRLKLQNYIDQILDSQQYTNFGYMHNHLREKLETYLKVDNLLLVANGTLALEIAIKTHLIETGLIDNIGLNIDTTPYSFAATSTAIRWLGFGVRYYDVQDDGTIDPELVDASRNNLLVTTNTFGNPSCFNELAKLYGENNIIYDSSHCFGIKDKQKMLSRGYASTLSFHATKIFSTIEGGAIIFRSRSSYEIASKLVNFGLAPSGLSGLVGINAKLSEFHSAFGLTLLDDIENQLSKRRQIAELYDSLLSQQKFKKFIIDTKEHRSNYCYYPLLFSSEKSLLTVVSNLNDASVYPKRYFYPSLDTVFGARLNQCVKSRDLASRVLCLPIYNDLSFADVQLISELVNQAC